MLRLTRLSLAAALPKPAIRARLYSSQLDPLNKKDYLPYVNQWTTHFRQQDLDDFELERGLNHIFAADWVPSVELIREALQAARRLDSFATSVRILEALENKVETPSQYVQYISVLQPLLTELGIPERSAIGDFDKSTVRDKDKWWY